MNAKLMFILHGKCNGIKKNHLELAQAIGLGQRKGYLMQIYLKNVQEGLPILVFGKNHGK